ncbi:MAG: hypothetical protein ACP5JH_12050, partial [Bacteroidota bacterium]
MEANEMKRFLEPPGESEYEILPTGAIYLPYPFYVRRLNEVFPNWTLKPTGGMKEEKNKDGTIREVCVEYTLSVGDFELGTAWGTGRIRNAQQDLGTALEAARSNALVRICMKRGLGLEVTSPDFVERWRMNHAEWYRDDNGRQRWRKRKESQTAKTKKSTTKDFAFLKTMGEMKRACGEDVYYSILKKYGYQHADEILERKEQVKIYKELQNVIQKEENEL